MTKDELTGQIARWAKKAGANPDRVRNYAERAGAAYDQLVRLSKIFAADFNRNNPRKITVSVRDEECARLVELYTRQLLNFKLTHQIRADDRLDTYICAGLWFCAIVQNTVFGYEDDAELDTASDAELDVYDELRGRFAFYFAFQVLRGHYTRYKEQDLLAILAPIRKYMVVHIEDIASSPAASVGIFHTISVFDRDCRVPSILS